MGGGGRITGGTVGASSYSLTGEGTSTCTGSLSDLSISGTCGEDVPVTFSASGPDGRFTLGEFRGSVICNLPPKAVDDNAETTASTSVNIPVLANDLDPDGDSLKVIGFTSPVNGIVTVNNDYTITYTPNEGFSGPQDSFEYTISDGKDGIDSAIVIVKVQTQQEKDTDGDSVPDSRDNCPTVPNKDQADKDGDGIGNACEADKDGDRVIYDEDNCPTVPNADQADKDGDRIGNACDNAPDVPNPDQKDADADKVADITDNCPSIYNPNQTDQDKDGIGDVCDSTPLPDPDRDGIGDQVGEKDNCPNIYNPDRKDEDRDGIGDACDSYKAPIIPGQSPVTPKEPPNGIPIVPPKK